MGNNSRSTRLSHLAAKRATTIAVALVMVTVGLLAGSILRAATTAGLGSAGGYAVLAAATVTNTGPSIVNGDLGLYPGTAVVGFPPGIVSGTIHAGDAAAAQAQTDLTTADTNVANQPCDTTLTSGADLAGFTLTPGVYCAASSILLSGILTLDGQGDPNAVFIFKAGSTVSTASASNMLLINGANPCNVFWHVGSSATLGTASHFAGNILAFASITVTTGADVDGRVLAQFGSVTLDDNIIGGCSIAAAPTPTPSLAPTATPTAPAQAPTPASTATPSQTAQVTPAQSVPLVVESRPSPVATSPHPFGDSQRDLPRGGIPLAALVLSGVALIVAGEFLRRSAR